MGGLPWFRMYSEFAKDPKVQSLSETLQRRFIMFLCLQCSDELAQLNDDELACALRIPVTDLVDTVEILTEKGLLKDRQIVNWNKRQFKSDDSRNRVREFRKRRRNGDVTPPDTENRYREQIQSKNTSAASRPAQDVVPRGNELLDVKLNYPSRAGGQPWRKAQKAINARLSEGHTWAEMVDGARRYDGYCRDTQKIGTEYVMQAATFYGPEKHFLAEWKPPPSKADLRLVANLSAADEFMRRTE